MYEKENFTGSAFCTNYYDRQYREFKMKFITMDWAELQISGKRSVRDLWHQKDIGRYNQKFSVQVSAQGVVMIKISKR
jgi:hypothetical protein